MRRFSLFLCLFIFGLMPGVVSAYADMAISADQIWFSTDTLVSGEEVRVYATVRNIGDEDISGYVYFYHGATPIGPSQVVSTPAGGEHDQVWTDFIVPDGEFNIRAEIKGTSPEDDNPDNDLSITTLFEPIADEDGDGIEDGEDNCPSNANEDQADTDNDGQGDACDDDDDNDGLSDDVEEELGTNPEDIDSDDDGVTDGEDEYPAGNDPVAEPEPVVEPQPNPEPEQRALESVLEFIRGDAEEVANDEEAEPTEQEPRPVQTIFLISPNASFIYSPIDWRTYEFRALAENEDIQLLWDFGDGAVSSQAMVEHQFARAGTYTVSLTAIDAEGNQRIDSQVITLSFFHLQNPWILTLIVVLVILLGVFGYLFFKQVPSKTPAKKTLKKGVVKKKHD